MTRPLRVEYPGALYHVIARGNAQEAIYYNDNDRRAFLDNIQSCAEIHNFFCHAYCLMDNHYHLLIETPEGNLAQAMRDINGNYTQAFNIRHKRVGHLFQGRYKAFVIEKEAYLMEVARYIVLNPVRAGIVDHPRNWKWSSYNITTKKEKGPAWLDTDWILEFFGKDKQQSQQSYQTFITQGIKNTDLQTELKHGFILGSPQFIDWIWETQTNGSEEQKEHPIEQRVVGRPTLKELFQDIKTKDERNITIKLARFRCGYSSVEIAKHLKMHPSVIGRISKDSYNTKKFISKT